MALGNIKESAGKIGTPQMPITSEAKEIDKTGRASASVKAYAKAQSSPGVKEAVNVQISDKAKQMSLIKEKEAALAKSVVEKTPDVNEEKVAKYKDLIAKGQYTPDANKIAQGITREAIKDEFAKHL